MKHTVPPDYAGPPFTEALLSFLPILEHHSFTLHASGVAKKTVRIYKGGENFGYINGTVIQAQGVLGYHFAKHGRAADSCPKSLEHNLVSYFCEKYDCPPSALLAHEGSGSNAGNTYLILKDPQVALRVLLLDSGQEVGEELQIATIKERYVEGRLIDVAMQRRERSSAARRACLEAYGFSCFACKANLKALYTGLSVEVIHVHHEEPLSASNGERAFDPVKTMKPVCPNCHAVIHSRTPPYSVAEVASMYANKASHETHGK